MFPLPPNEAVVIAEIFRCFPGTREVEGQALTNGSAGPASSKSAPSTERRAAA